MSNPNKNYKILAVGNIKLRIIQDAQDEKIFSKNSNAIEEIWQTAIRKKGSGLSNGAIPNFIKIEKNKDTIEIISNFIEYKRFFAQRKKTVLKLGIKPVGVSGIIILEDCGAEYVIFAKRAENMTEYPGFFELIPSGSIDKKWTNANGIIDYKSNLLSEFVEETGLSKEYVERISGFALVLDINHNVYDICCEILLKAKKELILQKFSSKEYNAPVFVSMNHLDKFFEKAKIDSIVPTSMALIEAYKRSKRDK